MTVEKLGARKVRRIEKRRAFRRRKHADKICHQGVIDKLCRINLNKRKNMKTEILGKAFSVATTYVNAIANRDVEKILSVSADDIICSSPIGRLQGIAAFRRFHEGFARMIKKVTVLAAFGDDEQAVIVYNAETHPVPSAITAELIAVKNGKVASTEVIWDSAPFAAYMATVKPH
jgi:SnoaL-like domain